MFPRIFNKGEFLGTSCLLPCKVNETVSQWDHRGANSFLYDLTLAKKGSNYGTDIVTFPIKGWASALKAISVYNSRKCEH